MKKTVICLLAMLLGFSIGIAGAGEKATPQEVYEMVVKAASVMESLGAEGLKAFNDPKGEFAWKDTYVLVTNCQEGVIAAHPSPKLIGLQSSLVKCKKTNRLILQETCAAVSPKGHWIEYWWPKLGSDKVFRKLLFVVPVQGTPYQVAAGIYDDNIKVDNLMSAIK